MLRLFDFCVYALSESQGFSLESLTFFNSATKISELHRVYRKISGFFISSNNKVRESLNAESAA